NRFYLAYERKSCREQAVFTQRGLYPRWSEACPRIRAVSNDDVAKLAHSRGSLAPTDLEISQS
ncbi:MAG: hypothetical protein ABWY17_21610, partial [Pseudomonas sp.]